MFSSACRPPAGDAGVAGSSLSEVAVRLPEQVKGVTLARLTGNTSSIGADRAFETAISGSSAGGSLITFSRDLSNQNLKIGDNLFTVTLELLKNGAVVYAGVGDIDPFIIKAGQNQISFRLECKDASVCPKGSKLEVIDVKGSTTPEGQTPTIAANVSVADEGGVTTAEKRTVLSQCQTEVREKSCSTWGEENVQGEALCTKLVGSGAPDPLSVCEGAGTVYTCLDDYIGYCKTLGVVR